MSNIEFEILNRDTVLAHIKITGDTVEIEQFTNHAYYRQFNQKKVTKQDVANWLLDRCFPRTRANADELLNALGLKEYNQLDIVRKTHGLLWEDYIWVRFKGEELAYNDVKIRD